MLPIVLPIESSGFFCIDFQDFASFLDPGRIVALLAQRVGDVSQLRNPNNLVPNAVVPLLSHSPEIMCLIVSFLVAVLTLSLVALTRFLMCVSFKLHCIVLLTSLDLLFSSARSSSRPYTALKFQSWMLRVTSSNSYVSKDFMRVSSTSKLDSVV